MNPYESPQTAPDRVSWRDYELPSIIVLPSKTLVVVIILLGFWMFWPLFIGFLLFEVWMQSEWERYSFVIGLVPIMFLLLCFTVIWTPIAGWLFYEFMLALGGVVEKIRLLAIDVLSRTRGGF